MKKSLSLLLAIAMVFGMFASAASAATPTTAQEKFDALKAAGIFTGKGANQDPALEDNMTRAEFARVLGLLKGINVDAEPSVQTFKDVPPSHWAYQEIEAAVAAGLLVGKGNGIYDPQAEVTVQELAVAVAGALGLEKVADAKVEGAADWAAGYIQALINNGINLPTNYKDPATRGVLVEASYAAYEVLNPTAVTAVSAEATAANKITVKFSGAVDADVKFAVKRGSTTVDVTPTWAADKKSVELKRDSNFLAGDYTVTVTGLEKEASFNLKIEAEKIAKIEILSSALVITPGTPAQGTAVYKVYNQYGEDITKKSISNTGINWSTTLGTSIAGSNGTITVNKGSNFNITDTLTVTGIATASAVVGSKTLAVKDSLGLTDVEFGEPKLPTNKTLVETGTNPAAWIPVSAKDFDGVTRSTYGDLASQLTLLTNAGTVALTDIDNGASATKQAAIRLDTTGVTTDTAVTISVIVNSTAKIYTTTVDVKRPAAAAAVEFGGFDDVIAAGDQNVYIPLVVTDQFGNTLDADKIVSSAGGLTLNSTNGAVIASNQLSIETAGPNKGKLKIANVGIKGNTSITVTVNSTAKTVALPITVQDARTASDINVPANLAKNLIQGATVSFGLKFKDQYGKDRTPNGQDDTDYNVVVTFDQNSGDPNAVTINGTTGTREPQTVAGATYFQVTAAPNLVGSYTFKAQLVKTSNNTVVDEVSHTFTVVKNNQSGLTYSLSTIDSVYGGSGSLDGNNPYAVPVNVEVKDASGNTYALPYDNVINVTSSNPSLLQVVNLKGNTAGAIDRLDNRFILVGQSGGFSSTETEKKATITVYVNTLNGIQTFTQEVTVAKAAPAVQEIKVIDSQLAAGDPYTLPTGYNEVADVVFGTRANAETGVTAYVYTKDQYGVWTEQNLIPGTANQLIQNTTHFTESDPGEGFAITGGQLILIDANDSARWTANETIKFSFFFNGKTQTINVKIAGPATP